MANKVKQYLDKFLENDGRTHCIFNIDENGKSVYPPSDKEVQNKLREKIKEEYLKER